MRTLHLGIRAAVLPLLVIAIVNVAPSSVRAPVAVPRFERSACPFTLGQGILADKNVICGYLVVPENRQVAHSPMIRLAVAIFKSPSPDPAPDPVIFLQGGPGGAIINMIGSLITSDNAPIIVGQRDLVLIDQRGTGYSRPSLVCSELNNLTYRTLDEILPRRQQYALEATAGEQCRQRLLRQGIGLSSYTSDEDAADIHDLQVALSYNQVNLYGVSYGTRLALTIMRDYPSGIRSVILDSVDPLQTNVFVDSLTSSRRAFDTLFSGCAANVACRRAYPQLEQTFLALYARLNAHPITAMVRLETTGKTYRVAFDGPSFVDLTFNALYDTSQLALLPQMIEQTEHGSTSTLARVAGIVGFGDDISHGVYYSVECGEDAPFVTPAQIIAAAQSLPAPIRLANLDDALDSLTFCRLWHVPRVPLRQKQAVSSSIPTLLLAGQYDPITPPANAALAARTLSKSYVFTFPGTGHGVFLTNVCPIQITAAFLNAPDQRPDSTCITQMSGPNFIGH